MRRNAVLSAGIGLLCVLGCGGGDVAAGRNADQDDGPLYVVSTGLVSGEEFLGYLATVRSLEPETEVSLHHAAETGYGAWIFNRPGDASVYAASLGEPTIVRWEIQGDAKFARRETLNLSDLGVQSAYLAASAPVFSAEKSYFVDETTDQVIIWNPSRMEYIGSIPLGDDDEGALRPIPEGNFLIRGDKLLLTVGWRDEDDTSHLGDHVRVLTIDTKTDTIVDSSDEERAGHEALNAQTSDGTAYFSPFSLYAAYRVIGRGHGAASRLLRVRPGAASFDADYDIDLSSLVGGRPAGDFTLLDEDTALLRVWRSELVDAVDPDAWQDVLWTQTGFLWWRWKLGDTEAVQLKDQEPGALGASVFRIDDKTYMTRYAEDGSSTDLIELTPDGTMRAGLRSPGQIIGNGVIRVR